MAFIVSSKFTKANYGKNLRKYLSKNVQIVSFIDFNDLDIFHGISAYPAIVILKKDSSKVKHEFVYKNIKSLPVDDSNIALAPQKLIDQTAIDETSWTFNSKGILNMISRKKNLVPISQILGKPNVGIKSGFNDGYILSNLQFEEIAKQLGNAKNIKPYLFGKDVRPYTVQSKSKIIFPYKYIDSKFELEEELDLDRPVIEHLRISYEKLINRAIIKDGLADNSKLWYEYQQINRLFSLEKYYIVYPNVSLSSSFALSKGNLIDMTAFYFELKNDKDICYLPILNSKLINKLHQEISIERRGGYRENKTQYIEQTMLPKLDSKSQENLVSLYSKRVAKGEELLALNRAAEDTFVANFKLINVPKKIEQLLKLGWNEIIAYLELSKIYLDLNKKEELMHWFKEKRNIFIEIEREIATVDNEINNEVYRLYGLDQEEIAILENDH